MLQRRTISRGLWTENRGLAAAGLDLFSDAYFPPPLARVCNACLTHKYVFTPILVIHFVFFRHIWRMNG